MKLLKLTSLLLGAVLVIVFAHFMVAKQSDWQETTGAVVGQYRMSGKYRLVAEYVVNGKTYKTSNAPYEEIKQPIFGESTSYGQQVSVWYDPNDPMKSTLSGPENLQMFLYIAYAVSGIMVVSGIVQAVKD